MSHSEYHQRIVQYYKETLHAYKDSWALEKCLAIHYGYWDKKVKDFPTSLLRMNEVMMEAANIKVTDKVLDAGCGIGGSSLFMAAVLGCRVTGISLSPEQVEQARNYAIIKELNNLVDFNVMDYCHTDFPDQNFDVIWGCESVCYAPDKAAFIKEAYRLLRPGGRLVIADGFVNEIKNNDHPVIRKWLDGWQVNYLETPDGFKEIMHGKGFEKIEYRDISNQTNHSAKRLYKFYFLATLYLLWKKINFSQPATDIQRKNIDACKYQYIGRKKSLWSYGLITATKPLPSRATGTHSKL